MSQSCTIAASQRVLGDDRRCRRGPAGPAHRSGAGYVGSVGSCGFRVCDEYSAAGRWVLDMVQCEATQGRHTVLFKDAGADEGRFRDVPADWITPAEEAAGHTSFPAARIAVDRSWFSAPGISNARTSGVQTRRQARTGKAGRQQTSDTGSWQPVERKRSK